MLGEEVLITASDVSAKHEPCCWRTLAFL